MPQLVLWPPEGFRAAGGWLSVALERGQKGEINSNHNDVV